MKLSTALDLTPGDTVAFVGAGGKTYAMFQLAEELASQGWRVITTTTTDLEQDELKHAPQRMGFGHGMRLPTEKLSEQLGRHGHVFVFTRIDRGGKVRGVRKNWLDDNLTAFPDHDILLVEADGSRRMSMKAPLPDEPVVPEAANVVVPVVGLDVLDQPLTDEHVYGAEYIHKLIGYPAGETVTPALIAAVLMHPNLGVKHIPAHARIAPLLNKVTDETIEQAYEIARLLLTDLHIDRVLIGAAKEADNPIRHVKRRIGAVVLAAGQSERMGEPKMLLPWEGSTVIRHVCQQVSHTFDTVVVTGGLTGDIRAEVGDLPVRIVENPAYEASDMLTSVQVGLNSLWNTCDAAFIVLGDQPMIEQRIVDRLMDVHSTASAPIIIPSYDQQRGHPILLNRSVWPDVMDLAADATLRDLIHSYEDRIHHVEVTTEAVLGDIDTPEDYQRARQRFDTTHSGQ